MIKQGYLELRDVFRRCVVAVGVLALVVASRSAEAQTTTAVHVLAVTNGRGGLKHTMRVDSGAWATFGDVEGQAGEIGNIGSVEAAMGPEGLHVVAITETAGTGLFHTIRFANGSWQAFGDMNGAVGNRGPYRYIGLSAGESGMHVCANTSDRNIWHTLRRADGTWTGWSNIEIAAGNDPGAFDSLDCAAFGSELHVVGSLGPSSGGLWHAIRRGNGTWTRLNRLDLFTGVPAFATAVRVSMDRSGNLHVVAVTNLGHYHMIRFASGRWSPATTIESVLGSPGGGAINYSHGTDIDTNLHFMETVVLSGSNTDLFYTVRNSSGQWNPWTTLRAATGFTDTFGNMSVAIDSRSIIR